MGGSSDESRVPLSGFNGVLHLKLDGAFSRGTLDSNAVLGGVCAHAGILEIDHDYVFGGGAAGELLRVGAGALLADDVEKEGVAAKLCPAALAGAPTEVSDGSGVNPCGLYCGNATDEAEGLLVGAAGDACCAHYEMRVEDEGERRWLGGWRGGRGKGEVCTGNGRNGGRG